MNLPATRVKTCKCGTAETDLPMYFKTVTLTVDVGDGYFDDAFEDHMFHACATCDVHFCTCAGLRRHRLMVDGKRIELSYSRGEEVS